jgi:hypothetical protein
VRLTVHWRGKPLVAVDLVAMSPEDAVPDGPPLEATSGGEFERAGPMEPDTTVRIGFGGRFPDRIVPARTPVEQRATKIAATAFDPADIPDPPTATRAAARAGTDRERQEGQ